MPDRGRRQHRARKKNQQCNSLESMYRQHTLQLNRFFFCILFISFILMHLCDACGYKPGTQQ